MNVMFYTYGLNMGGAERTVSALANQICHDHSVTIVQYIGDEPFFDIDSRVHRVALGFNVQAEPRIKRTLRLISVMRNHIRNIKPDVIFCFSKSHLLFVYWAARIFRIPVIGTERTIPITQKKRHLAERLRMELFSVCSGIVFQTQRVQAMYPRRLQAKSVVIPNALFNREIYDLPYQEKKLPRIVAMGRLMPMKGYDVLIQAFAQSRLSLEGYRLLIYGKGGERDRLQNQIDEGDLQDAVCLMGEDVHAYQEVAISEIFVLSSRYEGMPNTLIEAMGCGVACIATDCTCGPAELIKNEVNGLLVPVDDVDALANAMSTLAHDAEMRGRFAREGMRIRETHSIEAISKRWLAYADLLKK